MAAVKPWGQPSFWEGFVVGSFLMQCGDGNGGFKLMNMSDLPTTCVLPLINWSWQGKWFGLIRKVLKVKHIEKDWNHLWVSLCSSELIQTRQMKPMELHILSFNVHWWEVLSQVHIGWRELGGDWIIHFLSTEKTQLCPLLWHPWFPAQTFRFLAAAGSSSPSLVQASLSTGIYRSLWSGQSAAELWGAAK